MDSAEITARVFGAFDKNVALVEKAFSVIIRNRSGDGFCPMESAVRELNEPEKALAAIKQTQKDFAGSINDLKGCFT